MRVSLLPTPLDSRLRGNDYGYAGMTGVMHTYRSAGVLAMISVRHVFTALAAAFVKQSQIGNSNASFR